MTRPDTSTKRESLRATIERLEGLENARRFGVHLCHKQSCGHPQTEPETMELIRSIPLMARSLRTLLDLGDKLAAAAIGAQLLIAELRPELADSPHPDTFHEEDDLAEAINAYRDTMGVISYD